MLCIVSKIKNVSKEQINLSCHITGSLLINIVSLWYIKSALGHLFTTAHLVISRSHDTAVVIKHPIKYVQYTTEGQ